MKKLRFVALVATSLATVNMAAAEPAAYESPQAAVDAVIDALDRRDREALVAIFGPESEDVVLTGNAEQDRETWSDFLASYNERHRVGIDETGESATLFIGDDFWAFPAPIVKGEDDQWRFDGEAARDVVLARRIGGNELDVIDLMRAYVDAQREFRTVDYDGDGVMEFADAIISDPGEYNGLYWPPEDDGPESPVGDFMARAAASGYSVGDEDQDAEPYFGYYYKVLRTQGPDAPGGALDYEVNGHMLAGHALLAFPAAYGDSGIMSFMVGENGTVYEADLGEDTLEKAAAIEAFLPDDIWHPVD